MVALETENALLHLKVAQLTAVTTRLDDDPGDHRDLYPQELGELHRKVQVLIRPYN